MAVTYRQDGPFAVKLGQAVRPHDVLVFVARVWSDSGEWDSIRGQGCLAGKGNRQRVNYNPCQGIRRPYAKLLNGNRRIYPQPQLFFFVKNV